MLEVARRLKLCVREMDKVASIGGDEFMILLENISADEVEASKRIAQVAEKIRSVLAAPYQIEKNMFHSTPSIGVCHFCGNDASVDDLVKRADMAMYKAKDYGRNRVQFFDPNMQQSIETRASIESDLRAAITGKQLRLYFQIQLDHELRPVGAEALIRWIHPQHGMVSPAHFIPVAEESLLI